jgi:predicted DCC family thiol-disulfide oxidoreductase YuxK
MKNQPIILFDGVCNLCNGAVNFVIDHDKQQLFLFASLQSEFGQQTLETYQLDKNNFNSFLLLADNKVLIKSSAALTVAKKMGGFWQLAYILMLVPPFIRNFVYDLIAKNRYRWFGQQESCRMPTPELKSRFLG